MTFTAFLNTYGWALVAVGLALISFGVNYLLFAKALRKKLAPLDDTREAYIKLWIALGLGTVLAVASYFFVNWACNYHIDWVWYALGSLVGALFAIVREFRQTGLRLHNIKEASEKVSNDLVGLKAVATKAGIVDDAKFEQIMAKVNAEITSKIAEAEALKDENTVTALKEALISYLVTDGKLDDVDKAVLTTVGVTQKDLDNSKVMFDFLNNK
ncbi:MAG: hypothetical protein IKW45_06420 [Clostridia bacterium]|nr:hypothetical protein [Clostridia bacterium]